MLSQNIRIPKVVTVRVHKAENLRVAPRTDHKQKKVTQKWKVVFLGGKKKMSSESVLAPAGNPIWDYEVTFKIASRDDPVVLLVTDSEDNHVGQVVIPSVSIQARPTNPAIRPFDASRLCVADLEPTRKISTGFGRLYFWIWVEEYRSEETSSKSSRGSVLSLSSSHHRLKNRDSGPDALSYNGSLVNFSSSQVDLKDKKKPWYKKRISKSILESTAALAEGRRPSSRPSDISYAQSMSSLYNPTGSNLGRHTQHTPVESVIEDRDGSVLGAYSDLTPSDLYGGVARQQSIRTSQTSLTVPGQKVKPQENAELDLDDFQKVQSVSSPSENPRHSVPDLSTPSHPPLVPERELFQNHAIPEPVKPIQSPLTETRNVKPELIRLTPKSGSSKGGTEVTVYCRGLTEQLMQHASVLVDGYSVPRQDWFLQESSNERSDRSQLRIHMPRLAPGQCFVELDTMAYGRIRCPQAFTYLPAEDDVSKDGISPTNALDQLSDIHEDVEAVPKIMAPLTNLSSQNSDLSTVSDLKQFRPKPASAVPNSLINEPVRSQAKNLLDTRAQLNGFSHYSPDSEVETASGLSGQLNDYAGLSARHRASDRSAASGRSKSILDAGEEENLRLENEGLRSMLNDANRLISKMKSQAMNLESELADRTNDVDRLSRELCRLRNLLLQDGMTKYLEKV